MTDTREKSVRSGEGEGGTEGRVKAARISAHLGGFRLREVSFDLPIGASLGIIGPSGAGKTLLLEALAGLVPLDGGRFFLGAEALDDLDARRRRIGFVFQDCALYPGSGSMNIAFPAEVAGAGRKEAEESVRRVAAEIGLPGEYLSRQVEALPAGMKRLVALARAENREARLFLMDEPLVHLDPELRRSLRLILARLRAETRITTVYAFNETEDALALSEWLLALEEGSATQFGTAEEVYERPATVGVMRLLSPEGLNELEVEVRGGRTLPWDLEAPVSDGRWLLCFRPEEIALAEGGPLRATVDYAVARDGRSVLASARLESGAELRAVIPAGSPGTLSLAPLAPRFFPLPW